MFRKNKILIAEDDHDTSKLLGAELTRAGCEVAYAKDGEETLRIAQEQNFDVILMDMMMPEVTGEEVARTLQRSCNRAQIIAVTAKKMSPGELVRVGVTELVDKPIIFTALFDAIDRAIAVAIPERFVTA